MTRVAQLLAAYSNVERRAAIFDYPVREMQQRRWINETNDTAELEQELCKFFHAASVKQIPEACEKAFCAAPQTEEKKA